LSQASEEGEELVVGPISPRFSVERCDCVKNPLLQLKIGMKCSARRIAMSGTLSTNAWKISSTDHNGT
jgi:hypothetical protein